MKKLVTVTFDASAKTVTFPDYTEISLERVLIITNVTDGIIIYLFSDPAKGGSVNGNVLTLEYNTTSMSDSDSLQVFYDDPYSDGLTEAIMELVQRLAPLAGAVAMVGGQALRTQGVGTFTVSGPQTSAQFIASHNIGGVNYPEKVAETNQAAQANINNCVGG